MKNKRNADVIMESLEGAVKAELSPFAKAKISNFISFPPSEPVSIVNKYTLVFAFSLLLILFNLFFFNNISAISSPNEKKDQAAVEQFSNAYNLNNITSVNYYK